METLVDSFAADRTEEKVVLYVDILGFGNWISKINEDKEKKVLDLYAYLRKKHAGDGGIYQIEENAITVKPTLSFFSDSIISSYPTDVQKRTYNALAPRITDWPVPIFELNIHTFSSAFYQAIQLQAFCMINLGLLTRGAITFGKAFHRPESNIIFGPAITRAVHLEEEIAVTPRIIIDDRITEIYNPKTFPFLQQDSDGYWFVNCLYLDLNSQNVTNLFVTRNNIVNGLKSQNDRHQQKWKWMATLFNQEFEKSKNLPKDLSKDEFKIPL